MIDEKIIESLRESCEEIRGRVREWRSKVGAPETQEIECLNLVMKKENALAILQGSKNVEYRPCSQHYISRLYDKAVEDFYERRKGDKEIADQFGHYGLLDSLRQVKKIHFHNYSNTWFLDVEIVYNDYVVANKDGQAIMNDVYSDHELDPLVRKLDRDKEKNRPMFFFFAISKILGSNL